MIDTKTKILDTAERLFADQGYDATSLRQIIAEAGVNVAAIHYHFGSKEELVGEGVLRRAAPGNAQRVAVLERLVAQSGPVGGGRGLNAFLAPTAPVAEQNPQFVRLMGRMHSEGLLPGIAQRHFQQVIALFRSALQRALPDLPKHELLWRLHFMIGAMAHTMCGSPDF